MSLKQVLEFLDNRPDPREMKRALAVKLRLEYYPYKEISRILKVSKDFIGKWIRIYKEKGVNGLHLAHKGFKSYLTKEAKQEVLKWLKEKNYWNLTELQIHLTRNYKVHYKSNQSYYNLFQEAGISWKKTQKRNPKKDPKAVEKKKSSYGSTQKMGT